MLDNHYTEFVASASGYEDKKMQLNPVRDTRPRYKMTLKKLPKDAPATAPQRPRPPADRKPDKPDATPNKTNGELGNNPFMNSGNPPPKKP